MKVVLQGRRGYSVGRKAGTRASRGASARRMTLEELVRHPAFGMWKDKTISVENEVRQWRKPRYGLG